MAGWILSGSLPSLPLGAQSDAPAEITTLRLRAELVMVDASIVMRRTGEAIGELSADDLVLEEDGVEQELTYLSTDRLPLSLVFLFDLTDTVRPVLKQLAAGTLRVLDHLRPEDEMAVAGFSSRVIPIQDFTRDHSLAAAAIAKVSEMKDKDGTFIYEDMFEAVDEAGQAKVPGSRRVLVWLTDGTANLQNRFTQKVIGTHSPERLHSREEATDKLLRSGVVTSALIEQSTAGDVMIGFSYLGGTHMGDVKRYAELTGGPVLETSREKVADQLGRLLDELRQRHTLGYKPTSTKPPGTYCTIKLQLSPSFFAKHPEMKRRDVVIRTRAGYYR